MFQARATAPLYFLRNEVSAGGDAACSPPALANKPSKPAFLNANTFTKIPHAYARGGKHGGWACMLNAQAVSGNPTP